MIGLKGFEFGEGFEEIDQSIVIDGLVDFEDLGELSEPSLLGLMEGLLILGVPSLEGLNLSNVGG